MERIREVYFILEKSQAIKFEYADRATTYAGLESNVLSGALTHSTLGYSVCYTE